MSFGASSKRKDDLSSLTTEVLQLRLQALNLPITGSRARLVATLRNALQQNAAAPAKATKRSKCPLSRTRSTSTSNTPAAAAQSENISDAESEASFAASDHEELSDARSSPDDILSRPTPHAEHNPFSAAQLSVIRDTVQNSIRTALAHSGLGNVEQSSPGPHNVPPYRASGFASPLGLNRPLDKAVEDRILRGEYIDYCSLLPDLIQQSQIPDIQFRLGDSSPGPVGAPITMVRKRKPQIDSFH